MPQEIFAATVEDVRVRDYEDPPLKGGQLRLRAEHAAAKHGTELAVLKGYARARGRWDLELRLFQEGSEKNSPAPMVPGNMVVGRIAELGPGVSGLEEGDRVLSYGAFRQTHTLEARPGVTGDGRVLVKVPESLDWRSAVCLDPAAYALAAVRDAGLRPGDAAAVFSLGAIGLLAVQWAHLAGASPVIAVEPLEKRRRLAAALGADLCLDPASCDAGLEIKKATGSRGADASIEYSGSPRALQAALRGAAFGGTVVCGAFPPPYGPGLDLGAEAHMNRPRIVFSRAASDPNADHPRWSERRVWETCWQAILDGRLRGQDIVDPVVPFSEAPVAFARMAADPASSIKLGVRF
jgi:threonine dehydrogenase-like Zn-dependent dehydrogenase